MPFNNALLYSFQLYFKPDTAGQRADSYFQVTKYDWSMSDGPFRDMIGLKDVNKRVKTCNEILYDMKKANLPSGGSVPVSDASEGAL